MLYTLWNDFEGIASKAKVTKKTVERMEKMNILKEDDYEIVSTGETKAENTIAWARNRLKDNGYIKSDSKRGYWELTSAGIKNAKRIKV